MSDTDVRALLHEATANGVTLWAENGQLHFRSTNGKLTDSLRNALQSRKSELLGELSTPVFSKRASPPAVVRCAADRIGFWKECETDAALRHGTHAAFRLMGPIDPDRIEAAFERLVSRHDLLRSCVMLADDGIPSLRIDDDPPAPVSIEDLSGNAAISSSQLNTLVERAIHAPFATGQIYRAQVFKVSDSEHVVTIVIHHFVVDAFSVELLVSDLMIGLLGRSDSGSRIGTRPLQYADYLLGMNEWLSGPGLAYRAGLWKNRMQGVQGAGFPPTDASQRACPGNFSVLTTHVGIDLRASLARAAANSGVPFSTAILAANFAALARTFQRRDFFCVLLYSGRDDPKLSDMVGSTIGSIPVRVAIEPRMSFADLLVQVQDAFVFAVTYRIPWGMLMPVLAEVGAGDPAPFFNYRSLAANGANSESSSTQAGGLRTEPIAFNGPKPSHIVGWKSYEIQAVDNGADLHLNLRYMPSLYQANAIQAFAETYLRCLETLAADSGREVVVRR